MTNGVPNEVIVADEPVVEVRELVVRVKLEPNAWRNIAWSFALALVGTIQVFSVGDLGEPGDSWVHGLHGGLVLFVVAFAAYIAHREARAVGLLGPKVPA